MKKVIVISPSLRPGSNSNAMAELFAKGAEAAGHQVEFVSLRGKEIKFCDVYLLTTAAENEEFVPKRAEGGLTGWIDCFDKSSLKGHIFCGGVGGPKEIAGNAKLQEAYELGKQV